MTNYSIETALEATENVIKIDLVNKVTGTLFPEVDVYGVNTLGQVLEEYAVDIGANLNDRKILFENKRTGKTTSDLNETVKGFDLENGDVLGITDDATVAADEEIIKIDLVNEGTGMLFPVADVYGVNTLGQVVKKYAVDIGVNPNDRKILFINKRTRKTTSDLNETVKGFDLENGDVLGIADDAIDAADEEIIKIDLVNKATGTPFPEANAYGVNTLGQVLEEYAVDIGVNLNDSKILFENKRTRGSTSDINETVHGLGLENGDTLVISDNAGVA